MHQAPEVTLPDASEGCLSRKYAPQSLLLFIPLGRCGASFTVSMLRSRSRRKTWCGWLTTKVKVRGTWGAFIRSPALLNRKVRWAEDGSVVRVVTRQCAA